MSGTGLSQPSRAAARAGAASPWLSRIKLSNFRCYVEAELKLDERPVVLAGPNGAGKTNLLEAISFLAPGRGLRRARLGDIDRHCPGASGSEGPWAVAAEIQSADGPVQLGTGRDPAKAESANGERRLVRIEGEAARSQQDLAEYLQIVWLTPQMDNLFRDGGGERRRFLDRLVYALDPAHAGRVGSYEHAYRERARLLREGRLGRPGDRDQPWLTALEAKLAERGVAIAAARLEIVGTLVSEAPVVAALGFPEVRLALEGGLETLLGEMPALAAEEHMRAQLAAGRAGDAEAGGGASIGPHRSDLRAWHGPSGQPAELASTGEQKALLVAVLLAHARALAAARDRAPILLLDEVAAHLDEERRRTLFETLVGIGGQAWMTGTDEELFAPLGEAAQRIEVRAGTLRRHS